MDVLGVSAALLQPTIDQLSSVSLQISYITSDPVFRVIIRIFRIIIFTIFSRVCSLLKGFCLISVYLD